MPRVKPSLLIVVFLGAVLLHQPLRQLTLTIFRFPLTMAQSALGLVLHLPQLPHRIQEQDTLRDTLARQELELVGLREAIRHLTRATGLTKHVGGSRGIVASLLGRSLLPGQQTIMLDRGTQDGVVSDVAVVDVEGLIGRLLEAAPKTSVVLLVTDPNSRSAGLIERSRESGLVVGTGGRLCEFRHLDVEADVAVGDRVVTAGLDGAFPKGLLIGTVAKVERQESRGALRAWIRPAVRVSRLEEVLCLAPSSSE